MKSLAEQMSAYAAYHRHPVNKAIHFIFVPTIVWTIMVALDRLHLFTWGGTDITWAFPVTGVLLLWYLALDLALGIAVTMVFTMLLVTAIRLNEATTTATALTLAGVVFVVSWGFQFLGHGVWEKRKPALLDNLFQVFVAPIFVVTEVAFSLGFRKALKEEVEDRARELRAAA